MTPQAVGPDQAQALAGLHALAFDSPWSAGDFAALLGQDGVFALAFDSQGFILMREAAGEAEILTLAVAPAERRRGCARALLAAAMSACRAKGVGEIFLEVAADNRAAIALYEQAGFAHAGLRPNYYPRSGAAADALVLRCDLNTAAP